MRRARFVPFQGQAGHWEALVTRPCNVNVVKVLRLSRDMMLLADLGDQSRLDGTCGVLFGTLRDSAYKLRDLAEQEIQRHKSQGVWDVKEQHVD
jgi:hypothetical protein